MRLPERLDGKMIVTNTTRENDVGLLRERGLAHVITTTPKLEGRSFGTNVMEAALVALSGKRPDETASEEYLHLVRRLGWLPPQVVSLAAGGAVLAS